MQVHAFVQVILQEGAWKQVYAEGGRITYKAKQDHASLEIVTTSEEKKLRFRAAKGNKIAITGNSIHLPEGFR